MILPRLGTGTAKSGPQASEGCAAGVLNPVAAHDEFTTAESLGAWQAWHSPLN